MAQDMIAVFAGTFDPITLGHEDMVRRSAAMFGQVVVAVAQAHHKKTMFSVQERVSMVETALADCPGVRVEPFHGLMCDFMRLKGARVLVRGVRSATDFDYESQLAGMNRNLMPELETVFLPPSVRYQFVSSTLVREIATLGGEVEQFVSAAVHAQLLAKLRGNS
jgi:pantetheine-phosphate adenylyltransferase